MFKKALTPEQQTVHDIINRVCWAHGVKNKAALERKIALSDSWCTNTIKRGSIPYALIDQTAQATSISFDHLLYGSPMSQLDPNDLLYIKQGLIKSLRELNEQGFINKASSLEDLEQLAKKQAADIEHELTIQWNKNTKERA
ncbi:MULTISPECIES: hypothetical protein [unclassified Pseudoalteromonas]|uniref:hypothetical protein n=1 Tax=unclassified Pseudoalteromonas TaxID=194690 RepID=UPI0015FA5EDF|nr:MULTISPECIES: hypothetical protein [unclassified Pseudoalteromonas]MBB1291001.1 hypothetical protein [Pseudoalteromonas sp. SR41-5]MBB1415297.1 hypothetical protein [Pseudoalteromonas sp. SG43-8]